jgi:phosphoglycerate kinase
MKLINAAIALLALPTISAFVPTGPAVSVRIAAPSANFFELDAKKSIEDLTSAELKGKKVLVRCDVNVPLDGKTITDDTRIRSSIPTIEYLKSKGSPGSTKERSGGQVFLGPVCRTDERTVGPGGQTCA